VAVALAKLEHRRGNLQQGAELLGVAARLRGAEDWTHPEIAALTAALRECLGETGFDEAFTRARALDRDQALARLDPARLDPD